VGVLLPKFFIIYFGQKPPTSDITSKEVKMAFLNVGMGYKIWCTFAEEAINASCKIENFLENMAAKEGYSHIAFVNNYFNQHDGLTNAERAIVDRLLDLVAIMHSWLEKLVV
jgi:hypothetical protein